MQKYDLKYVDSDNTLAGLNKRVHEMFTDLLQLRPLDTMKEQITAHCQYIVKNGSFLARDIIVKIMFSIYRRGFASGFKKRNTPQEKDIRSGKWRFVLSV